MANGKNRNGLEDLVEQLPHEFYTKYRSKLQEHVDNSEEGKYKLFDVDFFDNSNQQLADKTSLTDNPLIIAQAGGTGNILSLASMIPGYRMLVPDKKGTNRHNLTFRTTLLKFNETREDYILDMFGLQHTDENKDLAIKFLEGDRKAVKEFQKRPFNKELHGNQIVEKINKETLNITEEGRDWMSKAVRDIGQYILDNTNIMSESTEDNLYNFFVEGVFEEIHSNPLTHYLANDERFTALKKSFRGKNNKRINPIQIINADITKDPKLIKTIIKKFTNIKGLNPVSIAYMPNLEDLTSAVLFLTEETEYTLHRMESTKGKERQKVLGFTRSSDLIPESRKLPGLYKYRRELKNRAPIIPENYKNGSTARKVKVKRDDLSAKFDHNFFLMKNLRIGSIYSDESAILDQLEMANARSNGNTVWITSGHAEGTKLYTKKKERPLIDDKYPTQNDQLKRAKEIRSKFNGPIIYVPNRYDWLNFVEDCIIYVKEKDAEKTGRINVDIDIKLLEQRYLSKHEDAFRTLLEYHLPYKIRLGGDPGLYTEEINPEGGRKSKNYVKKQGISIVEFVEAFKRFEKATKDSQTGKTKKLTEKELEKKLSRRDLEILDYDALWNTPEFSVFSEYSGKVDKETGLVNTKNVEKERDIHVFSDTKYSGVTQYKEADDVMKFIADLQTLGVLDDKVPESHLVDVNQANPMTTKHNNCLLEQGADMVDDSRYMDSNLAHPFQKKAESDPTHKRFTIGKYINLPSSKRFYGEPGKHMTWEFYDKELIRRVKQRYGRKAFTRDMTFVIANDNQIGSHTEDLEMMVKHKDFGIHELGAIVVIEVGDHVHGWNYSNFPAENALIGGIAMHSQDRADKNLNEPFFTWPSIRGWGRVEGNHERNSDWHNKGYHPFPQLEAAIIQHVKDTGHDMQYTFPIMSSDKKSNILQFPMGYFNINGLHVGFIHDFGKMKSGSYSSNPTKSAANFVLKTSEIYGHFDVTLEGHNHFTQMYHLFNRLYGMFGHTSDNSGFGAIRALTGSPEVGYGTIFKDGLVQFQVMTREFFKDYVCQNPKIVAAGGIEPFINEAIGIPIYPTQNQELQEKPAKNMYQRKPIFMEVKDLR